MAPYGAPLSTNGQMAEDRVDNVDARMSLFGELNMWDVFSFKLVINPIIGGLDNSILELFPFLFDLLLF